MIVSHKRHADPHIVQSAKLAASWKNLNRSSRRFRAALNLIGLQALGDRFGLRTHARWGSNRAVPGPPEKSRTVRREDFRLPT